MSSFEKRFREKVNRDGPDECWLWDAGTNGEGYGRFWRDGSAELAHRVAYELANGPAGDLQVNHHCDTRLCVNPDHLYRGTQADNMQDKIDRDRHNMPKGEEAPSSKLTAEDVAEIRRRHRSESVTFSELGEEFGVSGKNISVIVRGETWTHVNGGESE